MWKHTILSDVVLVAPHVNTRNRGLIMPQRVEKTLYNFSRKKKKVDVSLTLQFFITSTGIHPCALAWSLSRSLVVFDIGAALHSMVNPSTPQVMICASHEPLLYNATKVPHQLFSVEYSILAHLTAPSSDFNLTPSIHCCCRHCSVLSSHATYYPEKSP